MEYNGTNILLTIESLDGEIKEYPLPHDLKHGDKISLWVGKMILDKGEPYVDTQISRSWTINFSKELHQELASKE